MPSVQLQLNRDLSLKRPLQAYRTKAFRSLHFDEETQVHLCDQVNEKLKAKGRESIFILKGEVLAHHFIASNTRQVLIKDQAGRTFDLIAIPIAFEVDPKIGGLYELVIKKRSAEATLDLLLKAKFKS